MHLRMQCSGALPCFFIIAPVYLNAPAAFCKPAGASEAGDRMATQRQGSMTFFRQLRGNKNAFAMLLFEPMWGIPYNLFIPYFSIYMNDLGCTPQQIGLLSTIGMVFQVFFSLIAAPITDRLGRKRTTLIFDLASWSAATLIWAFANNFWFFFAVAAIQAVNRVVIVSWTCLMVEDADKSLLVKIFSWLTIAGLLSAVFSPLAAGFVSAYRVVPTMRVLLLVAFALMTAMFFLRNALTKETSVGLVRMKESRSEPFLSRIAALFQVTRDIRRNKKTLFFFILTAVYNTALVVKAPFFALLITQALHFSDASAGYFAAASSGVMLAVYFIVQPLLSRLRPKAPLSVGIGLCAAGSLLLIPAFGSFASDLAAVIASVILTSAGTAVAQPFIDGISHASIDNNKRANMTGILMLTVLVTSAPFGLIGGWLYGLNARLPFAAGSALFAVCLVLLLVFYRGKTNDKTVETIA